MKEQESTEHREEEVVSEATVDPTAEPDSEERETSEEEPVEESPEAEEADKYAELEDSYLRLRAEFDNYKKRTLREKADLMKNAARRTLLTMLDVLDDFDRAVESMEHATDLDAVCEGVLLVRDKFRMALRSEGVHEMEVIGEEFDPDLHEAVAMSDVEEPDSKGKIIDCLLKGYILNGQVLRHPKVVVGK